MDLVLELRPYFLALDLAALASRREFLNLDKWLSNSIGSQGGVFVRATLEFVGHKVRHDLQRQEMDSPGEPTTLSLSAATVALFMRALRLQYVSSFAPCAVCENRCLLAYRLNVVTNYSRATTLNYSRKCERSACSCTRV